MTTEPENLQRNGDEPAAGETGHCSDNVSLEERLAAAQEELEEYRREAGQSLDAAQRAQAELVNYRRRADDERIEMGKYSNSRLIAKLLPVMEELDLAVSHAGDGGSNTSWLEGVKLIQRKLANLLQSEGVSEIEAVGTLFNPIEHEALGTEQTTEYPPGYVAAGVRPGYRLHDRVILPAQVMVATEPESTENTEDTSDPSDTKEIGNG